MSTTPQESRLLQRQQIYYICLAAIVGICAGFFGSLFHASIDYLLVWPSYLAQKFDGISLMAIAGGITMLCTVFSVFIVRRYSPESGGSGVQEIEGAMENLRQVHWIRVLPVKFFIGITALSSGLALGREGPTIHIGASFGQAIANFTKKSNLEARGLLSAGAAAGLACAFNAPLASIIFIMEETRKQFPYTFRTYMGVIIAVVFSTIVTQMFIGTTPMLFIQTPQVDLKILPAFAILGIFLGLIGVALNSCILFALNLSDRSHKKIPYLYPAIIGLCIGILSIALPYSVTGGETVIPKILTHDSTIWVLILLSTLRFLTLIGSYSTGVPGGVFAPMLTLAVCVGLLFGSISQLAFPNTIVDSNPFAIAAMAALFTASIRSPIVGVALTLELTSAYTLTLPLILTCLCANIVAQLIGGRPLYEQLLERTLIKSGQKVCKVKDDPDRF